MIDNRAAHGTPPRRFRAVWISDIHLGTRGCQSDFLLDFLRNTESEYLYLAGDMIDGLTLTYNRTRQAFITKELIEIISGAEAL